MSNLLGFRARSRVTEVTELTSICAYEQGTRATRELEVEIDEHGRAVGLVREGEVLDVDGGRVGGH